MAHFTVKNVS